MNKIYHSYSYTRHSLDRAKERAGINTKHAAKMMALALERGTRASECRWSEDRRFLERRVQPGVEPIAYNGYCFIVREEDGCCLTVYRLPKNFGRKKTQYGDKSARYEERWA